jgi:hypothetical protein
MAFFALRQPWNQWSEILFDWLAGRAQAGKFRSTE